MNFNIRTAAAALLLLAGMASCKKEFINPNAPTQTETFASDRAATAVAAGLQRQYSAGAASPLYAMVNANGFVTNELILRNAGNIPELQLSTGGAAVDATNTVLANIWTRSNKIIWDANNVISYANTLADRSYASGLISFASIFKALSIGNLAQMWERVPDTTGSNVTFITRQEGFRKAVAVLNNAIAVYNANTPNTLVISRLPVGINIPNTLQALRARYSLFAGDYTQALAAANAVDLSVRSYFDFDALVQNPVFESATATNNVFQPVDSTLGLPTALAPDLADKRIPFYIGINSTIAPRYRIRGFYATGITQVPVYLPGEIMLIKAEAYARQTPPDLANALIELNRVVTKKPTDDVWGVGADLSPVAPATQAELLTEIYRQRSIELFMTGLKLEDMRRFERPLSERKRNFFPYPFQERDNNSNTPADPAF
jgi:hypothetical protein